MKLGMLTFLVPAIAAAITLPDAQAQTLFSGQATGESSGPVFRQSEFRHALAARAGMLGGFLNAPEIPRYVDRWAGMYESLPPAGKAGLIKSIAEGADERALREVLLNELPDRLAAEAVRAAGGSGLGAGSRRFKFNSLDASELVYKPTLPCRVADTRNWGGPVQPGKTRQIYVWSTTPTYGWANQGGTGTPGSGDCTLTLFQSGEPVQVLANVTIVSPSNSGNARTFDGTIGLPATSTVNFVAGQTVANAIAVPINRTDLPNVTTDPISGAKRDIGIYLDNASADVIVDVVGYFVKPSPIDLLCYNSDKANLTSSATGFKLVRAPACVTGTRLTGVFCSMSQTGGATLISSGVASSGFSDEVDCVWAQSSGVPITFSAQSRCCGGL